MLDSIKFKVREHLPKSQRSSRIFKTLLCFIIAIALTASIFVGVQSQKKVVMVIKSTKILEPGTRITELDLKLKEVGEYGLPEGIIISKDQVVGKYVKSDTTIYPADYITPEKLTTKKEEPFTAVNGNKKIMSFSVTNLAASVASNIEPGDIIQVLYSENVTDQNGLNTRSTVITPDCLKTLNVIDIKDANGLTRDATDSESSKLYSTTSFIPAVITVVVDDIQAAELYKAEMSKSIYAIFVERQKDII